MCVFFGQERKERRENVRLIDALMDAVMRSPSESHTIEPQDRRTGRRMRRTCYLANLESVESKRRLKGKEVKGLWAGTE